MNPVTSTKLSLVMVQVPVNALHETANQIFLQNIVINTRVFAPRVFSDHEKLIFPYAHGFVFSPLRAIM